VTAGVVVVGSVAVVGAMVAGDVALVSGPVFEVTVFPPLEHAANSATTTNVMSPPERNVISNSPDHKVAGTLVHCLTCDLGGGASQNTGEVCNLSRRRARALVDVA
jgi:hypothetical protein